MSDLLRADFFRIRKSKLTLVVLIIAVAAPVLITLLYLAINNLFYDGLGMAADDTIFDAKMLFGSAFSLGNNVGIVIPIFSGLFVMMDINNGTLRNKIICGKSRTKIYFSHLITSVVFNVVTILIYAAVTTALAFIFFDYGCEVNDAEIKNIIYYVISGILSFVFIASVSSFFALVLKSSAPTIIFTVVIGVGLCLIAEVGIILQAFEKYNYYIYAIPTLSNYAFMYGESGISDAMFWEGAGSMIFFSALNTFLGILAFRKKDIK